MLPLSIGLVLPLNSSNASYRGDSPINACPCASVGCAADINDDNRVDGHDLARVLGAWATADQDADVNSDGGVDGEDLTALLSSWGTGCGDTANGLPCPPPMPTVPAPIANPLCSGISDRFVGCTQGIKYLNSSLRLQFINATPEYIRDHSANALQNIINSDALASAVCATWNWTPTCLQQTACNEAPGTVQNYPITGCKGDDINVWPFEKDGVESVPGNAITLWCCENDPIYAITNDGTGDYNQHPVEFYKLLEWSLAVDFQFEDGWDDKMIAAAAVLEAQLTTVPPGFDPPSPAAAGMLYRGATVLCDEYQKLENALNDGMPLYARSFWSTSKDSQVAQSFMSMPYPGQAVQFVEYKIDYKAQQYLGAEIGNYACPDLPPGEEEVLFAPYVGFTVTAITDNPNIPGAKIISITIE